MRNKQIPPTTIDYLSFIGKTPLIQVASLSPKPGVRIFLKLEGFNASGSIKDRAAIYMVRDALKSGKLKPGMRILEATSGNMGIALSMIGNRLGYPVTIVAPNNITEERKRLMRFMGTEIIYTDGPTTRDSIRKAEEMANSDNSYCFLYQYANEMNWRAHYETTAVEIMQQLPAVDIIVAGLGSSGTVMGTGRYMREFHNHVRVIAVEPDPESRLAGLRNIEQDEYSPPIFNPDYINGRRLVNGEAAHRLIRKLAQQEGIFVGMSSGAVLYAALQIAEKHEQANIVAILADAGWKYMSIGICEDELPGEKGDSALIKAW